MNLYQVSSNWATRPVDQRFATLRDLYAATRQFADRAAEKVVRWASLKVVDDAGALRIAGPQGVPAKLTHWAFGQLAQRAGAPAGYLRTLPVSLASDCLNVTLTQRGNGDTANMLLSRPNGDAAVTVHAMLTDRYQRIWDWEVASRLVKLGDDGWQVATRAPGVR